jgi:hypothetical protein
MGLVPVKNRWLKAAFRFLIGVAAVIALFGFLVNIYWSPVVSKKLKSTIINSTDSLYTLEFSRTALHIVEGKIILEDIVLKPNMAVYNRRKALHLAPNSLYELRLKRLVLTHVHPFKLYFSKKLDIKEIVISNPQLQVRYEQNREQDTLVKDKKTPYQMISKVLKSIHVQNIVLDDVRFKYANYNHATPDISEFKDLNLQASELLIDSATQTSNRFLFCEDVRVQLNNYDGTSFEKRYSYKIKSLHFSTLTSQLSVVGFKFNPNLSPGAFFSTTTNNRFAFSLDSLYLDNFDFKTYSKYHSVYASKLTLFNGKVAVFSNPKPGDTTADQSKTFPHLMLKKLELDIRVDTVDAQKVAVTYTGYGKKTGQPGIITFENIYGKLLNITNNKAALAKNNIAKADLETDVMGIDRLKAQFTFNLTDDNAAFTYKGRLGPIDLQKLNPASMPLAMLRLSGNVTSVDFDMHANKLNASGTFYAAYNNLKIIILRKDDDNGFRRMGIASLLANALVIKHNNPEGDEPIRKYDVALVRKNNDAFFGYMWRSILAGLKETAGYDPKTEQVVKENVSKMKQNKLTKADRKARRIQRRAERQRKRQQRKQDREARKSAAQQPSSN